MFCTRKEYFSIVLSALPREPFRLTEMHMLSRKDTDLLVSMFVFLYIQGSSPEVTLRSFRDLEVICGPPKLLHTRPSYTVLGSMASQLHDMHIVCLLKAVTTAWVITTVPFLLAIDYICYAGSFEILQAKVKLLLSVGPVRPVPCALNKYYSARGGPINVSYMYFS